VPKRKPSSLQDSAPPRADQLVRLLGRSYAAFHALAQYRAGATCEWKRYGKSAPWVLRVSDSGRTLFYLKPQASRFEVTVVLGERATNAALAGRVRPELHAAIRSARSYVEGRPVSVVVTSTADVAGVRELIAVKLKPEMPSTA
jgi:hypothetical protein